MNSYDTLDEIREYLVPLNFHEYKPTQFDNDGVITCFQKRYSDDIGKKYFIDVKVFDFTFTDRISENYTIEYYCQLYKKGTHDAFNIDFIDWDIDSVESFIEDMFENNKLDYYEEWD